MSVICIVVPAFGDFVGGVVNARTQDRIFAAFDRIRQIKREGNLPIFFLSTGSRAEDMTMADHMYRFIKHVYRKEKCIVVTNSDLPEAFGTIEELAWVKERAQAFQVSAVEVVTNARHGLRVRATNHLVTRIPNLRITPSQDAPSWWVHECFAFLKLFVCCCGLKRLLKHVARFRRSYYRLG